MPKTHGIMHIALRVNDLKGCVNFYTRIIGMSLELETENYAYLSTGSDNLSLHEEGQVAFEGIQRLEHFGFACSTPKEVDEWYEHCKTLNAKIKNTPVTFGIGTRAFSVFDPSGNEVEFTYHPPMIR